MVKYLALLFAALSAIVSAFQLALAMGAPWGEFTLGGKWRGSLPGKARIIPLISIVLLGLFAAIILAGADIAFDQLKEYSKPLTWVVVGCCTIGTVANAIMASKRKRKIWLPVALLMLLISLAVAMS